MTRSSSNNFLFFIFFTVSQLLYGFKRSKIFNGQQNLIGIKSPPPPPPTGSVCCFTSTEVIRLIRDGELRMATMTFTQLLNSVLQCCFTSTETVRIIRDGEPRTATSTFTQFLSCPPLTPPPYSFKPCLVFISVVSK